METRTCQRQSIFSKNLNQQKKRKLPDDAPLAFIPKKLRPLVKANGIVDKAGWECALLTAVRDEIKAGNFSVKMSKRFGRFDDFFIESDLLLEEHYTDTHGYTENNFAAFAMLGRRFAPRIRGLHKQRIYRIDLEKDYHALTPLVGKTYGTFLVFSVCKIEFI